ncbi:MAG TPA: serine hydrolase domain-containing protein [Ilumatobacteraceae bacterium]
MSAFEEVRADLERLVALRSRQCQCSISWAVVTDGRLVLNGGHAAGDDTMPTERTVFRIASMTKSFTAAAVMLLRDRALLRLDDVVADIAPEFACVVGPTTDSPAITVRDLLSMASGMATDDVWADRHVDISDADLDALLSNGATFAWAPQTHGEYSNLGFAMLGRLILRVTGRRAQEFISDNLLRPLAMDRTTWVQPHHDDWARPHVVVDAERICDMEPLGDGAIAPMGGLWSCVSDLAKWVGWLEDAFPPRDDPRDGRLDEPLSRSSRREMQQVHTAWPTSHTMATGEGDEFVPERIDGGGYGFGLFVRHDSRFGHFVQHSGGLPGYGSNMRWLPGRGIGIIALANSTYAPMAVMTRRMLEIVDEHGLVPDAVVQPSAALLDAANRLADLLSSWTDDAAAELFADNVALDESFERRAAQARDWTLAHGTIGVDSVKAETPMSGRATLRHADGTERRIDLQMSPQVPPRLQLCEVVDE